MGSMTTLPSPAPYKIAGPSSAQSSNVRPRSVGTRSASTSARTRSAKLMDRPVVTGPGGTCWDGPPIEKTVPMSCICTFVRVIPPGRCAWSRSLLASSRARLIWWKRTTARTMSAVVPKNAHFHGLPSLRASETATRFRINPIPPAAHVSGPRKNSVPVARIGDILRLTLCRGRIPDPFRGGTPPGWVSQQSGQSSARKPASRIRFACEAVFGEFSRIAASVRSPRRATAIRQSPARSV